MQSKSPQHTSWLSYGLKVDSYIPLTGLLTSGAEPDVHVRRGFVRSDKRFAEFDVSAIVHRPGLSVRATKDYFFIDWNGVAACLIEAGTDVTLEVVDGVDEKDLIPLITGPILAVVLHQRDQLVLHASAVEIGGKAIVFLGGKGFGKSTLAAQLHTIGQQLLSDDIVPVTFANGVARTAPGHPQIRLFPDSVESIGLEPGAMPRVNTWIDKRHFSPDGEFRAEPLDVGCIFVLEMGDEVVIRELNAYSAFIEIARNTYTGAFLAETDNLGGHFGHCEKLVKAVKIFGLSRPHDFDRIAEITEAVVSTARSHT